jgi:hypothetical protein
MLVRPIFERQFASVYICKVERSVGLLHSLGDERKRWEASSETFKSQMATIVGDVLLSSAFMAYAGMIGFYLDYIIYG